MAGWLGLVPSALMSRRKHGKSDIMLWKGWSLDGWRLHAGGWLLAGSCKGVIAIRGLIILVFSIPGPEAWLAAAC